MPQAGQWVNSRVRSLQTETGLGSTQLKQSASVSALINEYRAKKVIVEQSVRSQTRSV